MNSLKPSRIYAVEDLFRVPNGECVRTAGLLKRDEFGKVFIHGVHNGRVQVNFTENIVDFDPGATYLIIGEFSDSCIFARIIKEISFKKYSLTYYLGKMPEFVSFKSDI